MDESSGTLKDVQELDLEIEEIRSQITRFGDLLAEVDEPAMALEQELANHKGRLKEMQVEERRLEHSADDRRARTKALRERLKSVRNLREEAAVQAEMDILQRALEGEEREGLIDPGDEVVLEPRIDLGRGRAESVEVRVSCPAGTSNGLVIEAPGGRS